MSLKGRLIVAEPTLADPNFHRTVVFLVEHGPEGALGVVLNRPGSVPVRDVIPAWAPYVSDPATLFVGGPVSTDSAICLASCGGDVDSPVWSPVSAGLGVLDLHSDPTDAPPGVRGVRVFGGYAGWSPGQLEAELASDGWLVIDAEEADVFSSRPEDLWRAVLARQRGPLRRFSAFPADPSLN